MYHNVFVSVELPRQGASINQIVHLSDPSYLHQKCNIYILDDDSLPNLYYKFL